TGARARSRAVRDRRRDIGRGRGCARAHAGRAARADGRRAAGAARRTLLPGDPVAESRLTPAPQAPPLLEARRLHLRHPRGERDVVRDVSLAVWPGEIVALVGPNGSGKSTTLAALCGALAPRAGDVRLDCVDLRRIGRRAL